jgi:hypothetical protein
MRAKKPFEILTADRYIYIIKIKIKIKSDIGPRVSQIHVQIKNYLKKNSS